jgi:hypothetical protein
MGDKRYDPVNLVLFVLFTLAITFAATMAFADDDYRGNNNPMDVSQETIVDTVVENSLTSSLSNSVTASPTRNASNSTSIGGNRAYALGMGSLDVAIGQCMGSTAWAILFVTKQKLTENHWCQAEVMYRLGFYDAAARIWCVKTVLGELYTDEAECLDTLSTVSVQEENTAPPLPDLSFIEELADEEEQHVQQINEQQAMLVELAGELDSLKNTRQRIVRDFQQREAERKRYAAEALKRLGGHDEETKR